MSLTPSYFLTFNYVFSKKAIWLALLDNPYSQFFCPDVCIRVVRTYAQFKFLLPDLTNKLQPAGTQGNRL